MATATTSPNFYDAILADEADSHTIGAQAKVCGMNAARHAAQGIATAIDGLTVLVEDVPITLVDVVIPSTCSKLEHDFAGAVYRDFVKTQLQEPINEALAGLALALATHMGNGKDAAKVLRDAAKQADWVVQEREAALRQAKWDASTAELEKSNAKLQASMEKLKAMMPLPTKFDVTITDKDAVTDGAKLVGQEIVKALDRQAAKTVTLQGGTWIAPGSAEQTAKDIRKILDDVKPSAEAIEASKAMRKAMGLPPRSYDKV